MTKNEMKKEISNVFGFPYREIKIESWNGGHGFIFRVGKIRYQGDTKVKSYNSIGFSF